MFGIKKSDEEYYDLSLKSFESGEYEKSLEYINIAINMRPSNGNYLFHKIEVLIEMADYEGALRELDVMESRYKNNPAIYSHKSFCYYSIEDYENSIKYADMAIKIGPEDDTPYFTKAISLKKLQRFDEAKTLLEIYLKTNITDSDAHSELADIYLHEDQKMKSLSEAKLALKYDKENQDAYNIILAIYMSGEEPEKYIETTAEAFGNTAEFGYLYALNDFLKMVGLNNSGEEIYRQFIKFYPEVNEFYDLLADILISQGKKEEAYSTYKKILENGDIDAYKLWFYFLLKNNDYELLVKEIKRYGKEDAEILALLYFGQSFLRDYDNALKTSEKLCNEYRSEEAKLLCATQLNNTGKPDIALTYLDSCKSVYDTEKNYEYFRSYLYSKDYEKSMKHARIVVDSGEEGDVISLFCQLVENSDKIQIYKFLEFEHVEEFNDVFSLLKSIAKGIYSNYEEAVKDLKNKQYLDCEYLNLVKEDFIGRAREFIEKYTASECAGNKQ
jgi:tetratricopeptide (TPR) repeat protein